MVWLAERKNNKLRKQEEAQRKTATSTPTDWSWLWFPAMMLLAAILREIVIK
jgi:hypothetical protein